MTLEPNSLDEIGHELEESIEVKKRIMRDDLAIVSTIANWSIETLRAGGKLILFGNGGSAADAQHIAAELVGRFQVG